MIMNGDEWKPSFGYLMQFLLQYWKLIKNIEHQYLIIALAQL